MRLISDCGVATPDFDFFWQPRRAAKEEDSGSERDHIEAGDGLEMLHVEGRYIEAEIEGRGPDNQVFDSDGHPLAACSPSMRPASWAIASETGCTTMSRASSSAKALRRTLSASVLAR